MASSWIGVHAALLHALARITGRTREALYPVGRPGKPGLRYYTARRCRITWRCTRLTSAGCVRVAGAAWMGGACLRCH